MQKINLSSWFLKGFAIAVLAGNSTVVAAAEAEVKKDSAAASAPAAAAEIKGAVARVNGTTIDAVELKRARKVMLRGQPVPEGQQAEVDKQALDQLLSAELLYQAASKIEVKDMDKLVDEKLAQGKARFSNEQDFAKAIKDLDMNEKDLRDYTRRDLLISKFVEGNIVPKVKVSEEDARKFYDQNPDKFTRSESVRASHILVGTDANASEDDKKKAREKAEKLHKELLGGADFAKLAKENSTCPSSQQGGDLGSFGKGQMVPPFEDAAFSMKPGDMSGVVETQFGYHIIKLAEKKAAETVTFKEAQPRIEEYLKGQKVNGAVMDYIAEARKNAKIEILLK